VVDAPSATDKSVRLNRTTDGGGTDGTDLARIFGTPLQGVVTIEAQVMRNDTQAGWFRTSMPGIGKIAWYANAAERGAVHVDDVRISGGPASIN
jgi:hypothetical protein